MNTKPDSIYNIDQLIETYGPHGALIYTINSQRLDIVNELLRKGVDPSENNNEAIQLASEKGYLDFVNRLLLDRRVDPSANNNFAFKWASIYGNGHPDVVLRLLQDERVRPSAICINFALEWASLSGNLDVIVLLLSHPLTRDFANINTALKWASEGGHLDVVNELLRRGADPSANNNEAIRIAIDQNRTDIVNRLLEDPRVQFDVNNYKKMVKEKLLDPIKFNLVMTTPNIFRAIAKSLTYRELVVSLISTNSTLFSRSKNDPEIKEIIEQKYLEHLGQ